MEIQGVQEIVTLGEICRACLIKTDNMKHLLNPSEEILDLITKLSSVSNLEIEISDTLPCFLCCTCEEKLKIAYDFQQLCQKSDQFIVSCLSATATTSVALKINNIYKPIQFEDGLEKQQLESTANGFLNFINNNELETEIQITYEHATTNVLVDGKNFNDLKETQTSDPNYFAGVDNLGDGYEKRDNFKETELLEEEETFVKPAEVEKKTKTNQTMRLPQYSPEEVDKLIKKTRERFFKHVNCLYCGFTAQDTRALSVHMTRLHKEMKSLWCIWCNNTFENLREHMKDVHKDNFKCPLCGKYRTNTGHFMEHLASHSTERKYVCKICEKSFISARHLKVHFYSVHSSDKPFSCQVCSKGFVSKKSLTVHLKTHKHKCKVCDEYFQSVEEYEGHKCFNEKVVAEDVGKVADEPNDDNAEEESDETPQNFCKECNRKVRSLQGHKEKYHSTSSKKEDVKALCPYCGKQFKTLSKLTVHVRIHTGEAPYTCSYCGKRMTTRVHLVVHERTHTGEKPCICKICGKGFAQHSVLNTHMRLHTGRPEQCNICNKRFCRASELRQHMRSHTGEKPFVCTYCGQGFKQKSHLVGHMKMHTNERPYKCDFCEKSFKQSGTLRAHRNIHLGKKPFKCSQCSYACRQSYRLNQHMQQHEFDHPKPDSSHRCGMCDRTFTTLALFSSHYTTKHGSLVAHSDIRDSLIEVATLPSDGIAIETHLAFTQ